MSNSITVGVPVDNRDGIFKPGPGVGDVKASGHLSNQVQIEGHINRAPSSPAPSSAPANDKAQPVTIGDSVETTHGRATVHRSIDGKTIVTTPNGLAMTWQEAEASGILTKATEAKPAEKAQGEPKDNAENSNGTPDGFPEVDLESHAENINQIGEALEKAGLDPEAAVAQAMDELSDDGELNEEMSALLIDALGKDGAQEAIDSAHDHLLALTVQAMTANGLPLDDPQVAADLDKLLDADKSVWVDAIRGKPARMEAIINSYAIQRSKN